MKKALVGALGGVAALAVASPAAADGESHPAGVLSAGYIFSAVGGRSGAVANGVEASYAFYPSNRGTFGLGPFAQWQSYGGDEGRWAVGGQFNVGFFGTEIGYARREGDDRHVATGGVHASAFLSAGLLYVAFRSTIVPDPPRMSYGPEYAFTLGVKLPLPAPEFPNWFIPEIRVPSGRPLRVGEAARVASVKRGRDWQGDVRPKLAGLTTAERAERAVRWTHDAQMEHASVASFSRLSLELLALGAPPELIEGSHRAALDEVRHARLCFALASAYAGGPLGAGELTLPPPRSMSLAELARESFIDGCLGEATAAAMARDELRSCTDSEVAAVLKVIARDEARHAKLAWQIVAWCLREGGDEVKRELEGARANAGVHSGEGREARCYARVSAAAGRRLRGLLGASREAAVSAAA